MVSPLCGTWKHQRPFPANACHFSICPFLFYKTRQHRCWVTLTKCLHKRTRLCSHICPHTHFHTETRQLAKFVILSTQDDVLKGNTGFSCPNKLLQKHETQKTSNTPTWKDRYLKTWLLCKPVSMFSQRHSSSRSSEFWVTSLPWVMLQTSWGLS